MSGCCALLATSWPTTHLRQDDGLNVTCQDIADLAADVRQHAALPSTPWPAVTARPDGLGCGQRLICRTMRRHSLESHQSQLGGDYVANLG